MSTKKASSDRVRNWTFVLYPESAVENWRMILEDYHIEWIESPLHDKDINANGEPKKPHIHILLLFGGVKSYEQVFEITDSVGGTIPQRVHNSRSLVRYFAHLDNPEKAQYQISDIVAHGGVDIAEMLKPCSSERYTILKEIISYIQDNEITEFKLLIDYAMEYRYDDWFPLLVDSSTIFLNSYIKSCRYSSYKNNDKIVIDKSTGEVL